MLISKNQLKVVAFASPDKTRQALNGILIRPEKNMVEATDGHCLVRVENKSGIQLDDFPDVKPFNDVDQDKMVSCDTVKKLLKAMPAKPDGMPILNYFRAGLNGDKLDFTITDLDDTQTITSRLIDGKFPDTDQVMPNEADHPIKIGFNGVMMADICKFLASVSGDNSKMITLHIKDKNSPLLMTVHNDTEEATAILMPMRF